MAEELTGEREGGFPPSLLDKCPNCGGEGEHYVEASDAKDGVPFWNCPEEGRPELEPVNETESEDVFRARIARETIKRLECIEHDLATVKNVAFHHLGNVEGRLGIVESRWDGLLFWIGLIFSIGIIRVIARRMRANDQA